MSTTRTEWAQDPSAVSEHLTLDDRIALLRYMLLMRGIEERAMNLYRQGKVPGSFYDGFGQEAVSAGAAFAMAAEDRLCILHRDLAAHLIRGVTPARILGQYMGRDGGVTGGRDGNVHFGDFRLGCVGMVSMLPDMMLVATGMAMAFKLRHERRCAITWFGDGSTSRGDFHEAMNWAGVQRLPVIFVLENNQYAYSTPVDRQYLVDPVERAVAYGFPGLQVDPGRGARLGPRARRSRAGPPTTKGSVSSMATKTVGADAPGSVSEHLTLDDRIALLRYMLLMRGIEERAMNLYRQGKVPGSFYDGFGQEAVSVGSTFAMSASDRLCILHRDLGGHLVRGVTPARILAQYMGRDGGVTGGRDGNVHFGGPPAPRRRPVTTSRPPTSSERIGSGCCARCFSCGASRNGR